MALRQKWLGWICFYFKMSKAIRRMMHQQHWWYQRWRKEKQVFRMLINQDSLGEYWCPLNRQTWVWYHSFHLLFGKKNEYVYFPKLKAILNVLNVKTTFYVFHNVWLRSWCFISLNIYFDLFLNFPLYYPFIFWTFQNFLCPPRDRKTAA